MVDRTLEQPVALYFSASNLGRADVFSKPDAYLTLKDARGAIVGKTETVKNSASPVFRTELVVPYRFEEEQVFSFDLVDNDFGRSSDDLIGSGSFKLGTVMGQRGQTLKIPMTLAGSSRSSGFVTIRAEQASNMDVLKLTLAARNLDNKDGFFSKSDPYCIVSAYDENTNKYTEVYRSEFIKNTLNPTWAPFSIQLRHLGAGTKIVRIEVTDYDAAGSHDLIGYAQLTVNDLINAKKGIPVIHPPTKPKYSKSSYSQSGLLDVVQSEVEKKFTFVDFLRGGLEVSLAVAVDFTGSNGDPSQPNSLHYGAGNAMNPYLLAIQGVGQIVMDYDSNKMVPALGFGARIGSNVSHCFPLSLRSEEVFGVQGIFDAYRERFASGVMLSGPTYFAEVLRKTAQIARTTTGYMILLLLTDGVLNDVQETIDAIVELSSLPVSVIIVGVGNADFSQMKALDADENPLISSRGIRSTRDCVQFVQFNQVGGNGSALARETLMELPNQLVQYMAMHKRAPGKPVSVREEEIMVLPSAPVAVQGNLAEAGRSILLGAVSL